MRANGIVVACLVAVLIVGFVPMAVFAMEPASKVTSKPIAPKGQRTVVLETFTATWCGPCTYETQALHQLEGEYTRDQVAIAEWHSGDAWDPVDGSKSERYSYYGVTGIPTVIFDGQDAVIGASSKQGAYDAYKPNIVKHLAIAGEVTVAQTSSISGTTVNVEMTISPEQKSGTFTARILLLENTETVDSNHNVDWVVRRQLQKQSVTLTQGQDTKVTGTGAIDASWKQDKLYTVSFVQDDSSKVVLNGNHAKIGGGGSDTEKPKITAVQHSPASPTDQDAVTVSATVTDNVGVASATLYYDDGSGSKNTAMTASGSTYSANIGKFAAGKTVTYYVEAKDAAGNVEKSASASFTVKAPPDTTKPTINGVAHAPASPTSNDAVTVSATITDNVGVALAEAKYDDGSGAKTATMTASGTTYSASIGKFAEGKTVTYHVEAKDAAGNLAKSTPDGSFTIPTTSQPPDVSVKEITYTPAAPKIGDKVKITVKVKNEGTGTATNVNVAFTVDGKTHDTKVIASIAPGATESVTAADWVAQADGTKPIKVEATASGDTNTANDIMTTSFPVAKTGGGGSTGTTDTSAMLMWLLPIIIIAVVVVILLVLLMRRKKPAQYYQQDMFGGGPQW